MHYNQSRCTAYWNFLKTYTQFKRYVEHWNSKYNIKHEKTHCHKWTGTKMKLEKSSSPQKIWRVFLRVCLIVTFSDFDWMLWCTLKFKTHLNIVIRKSSLKNKIRSWTLIWTPFKHLLNDVLEGFRYGSVLVEGGELTITKLVPNWTSSGKLNIYKWRSAKDKMW